MYVPLMLLAACDVHEWPEPPERVQLHVKLNYEKDMTVWNHLHDGSDVIDHGLGGTYDNSQVHGTIRYIIRAYPHAGGTLSQEYAQEFVFTKDIAEGYDHDVTLSLSPGDYSIMVWSDLIENDISTPCYDASDFAGISLQGDYMGCNDFRDAFRGTADIAVPADITGQPAASVAITMQRPLAKFEIVTNDLSEFIEKQTMRAAETGTSASISLDNYRIVFYYVGFVPDTYSMMTDKPVDSSTGIGFQSDLQKMTDDEGSLGFDYVFVNGKESAATVQIGVYDADGNLLFVTKTITVPLKRSRHTVIRGSFLTSGASGGALIDPGYNGNHNLIFP